MTSHASIPVRLSVLSDRGLRDWIATTYDLPAIADCRLISLSLNDVYRVSAESCRAYLRVYRYGIRGKAEIDAEVQLCNALAAYGISVSTPICGHDEASVYPIAAPEGTRFAVLWEEAPGEDVRELTARHARAYGTLAAQLHSTTDRLDVTFSRPPLDASTLIDQPMDAIRAALADDPLVAELEQVAAEVKRRLDTLSPQSSDVGLCHGDLHPGNARFADDGRPTLFDFDCCGYGWRAYDLAVFLWNSYGERRPRRWRESRWNAFLSGYRSIRPLPAGIDSHLADLMAARQIWLTGLDFAGQSGYPPQWIGPGLLRSMLKSIGDWRAEFPSQHVTS